MINYIVKERYWTKQLDGIIPRFDWPVDPSGTGMREARLPLPAALWDDITKLSGGAPNARLCCLAAALVALLHRYTQEEDILLTLPGFPEAPGFREDNVYFFRTGVARHHTVRDLLASCREQMAGLFRHQGYDHRSVIEKMSAAGIETDTLFQVGLTDGSIHRPNPTMRQCGLLFAVEGDAEKELVVRFNGRFPQSLALQLGRHFLLVLSQLPVSERKAMRELSIMTADEAGELLQAYPHPDVPPTTLTGLFAQAVAEQPEAAAVHFQGGYLSYAGLDERSGRVAAALVLDHSIAPGSVIAIRLESSFELMIAIIGVLKAGAVVLPIVPADPEERVGRILSDSRASLVITADATMTAEAGLPAQVSIGSILAATGPREYGPRPAVSAGQDAWVIYTSGSTGYPKGTRLTHDNLGCMMHWFRGYFELTEDVVFPQKTTVGFVDSIVELLLPILLCRSCVYLRPYDAITNNPPELFGWMQEIGASIAQFVPSVFEGFAAMTDVRQLPSLRTLILSGEPLKRSYDFGFCVYNLYGCSEATASSTIYRLTGQPNEQVTIGLPVHDTQVLLLDADLQLLPPGATGDIWLSGRFLSAGYLHNEALTAERFIAHPYLPGRRLYNTGDKGRRRACGDIEYLGRKDRQVKIRGMRIETAEVESILLSHPSIRKAYVLPEGAPGDLALAAFIECADAVSANELRAFLSGRLPAYMVPAYFVPLGEVPLTATGKVDFRRFPDARAHALGDSLPFVAPRTETERKLALIWEELLQTPGPVSVDRSFVELGGHSLKAIRAIARIERELGVTMSLNDFFRHPDVASVAAFIESQGTSVQAAIPRLPDQEHYELSHAQKRLWVLNQSGSLGHTYNMSHTYRYRGTDLDVRALEAAVEALVRRHESLRTVFVYVEGAPRQKPLPYDPSLFGLVVSDVRREVAAGCPVEAIVGESIRAPFDLERGPLIRTRLLQYGDEEYAFSCTLHHIITDGWSMQVLLSDLLALYRSFSQGGGDVLPPLRIQYRDYCHWHNALLANLEAGSGSNYWREKLGGEIPVLRLPYDLPRKTSRSYEGKMLRSMLDERRSAALAERSRENNVTLFVTLLTCVQLLLWRYSGQHDILIGSPIAGRDQQELERQIGFYLNNLVLRNEVNESATLAELLQAVNGTVQEAFRYQLYPFDRIVEDLNPPTPPGRNPFYDVMVVMAVTDENANAGNSDAGGFFESVSGMKVEQSISKLDLSFFFSVEKNIHIGIEYNTDLFVASTIEKMQADIETVVDFLCEDPQATVASLRESLMNQEEKAERFAFRDAVTSAISEDF